MADGEIKRVMAGFSLANRLLMYAGIALAPVQDRRGGGCHALPTILLLGYTFYQQYLWYVGAKTNQHHALSLFIPYFNSVYQITYSGGIPTDSYFAGAVVALGTSAVLLLNLISGWISILTNLAEGDGVYQFWFYGWRTLSKGWRAFFKLWMAGDTIGTAMTILTCVFMGVLYPRCDAGCLLRCLGEMCKPKGFSYYCAAFLAVSSVPLVVVVELTIKRNRIVSETDMISVYLFVAQFAMLMLSHLTRCFGWMEKRSWWPCAGAKGSGKSPILPTSSAPTQGTKNVEDSSSLKGDSTPVNGSAALAKELDCEHKEG